MDSFEFNVDEKMRPSVERTLTGTTKIDSEISSLPMPDEGLGKKSAVLLLRIYRRFAPSALRSKCVFDPSCSHYSELAYRQHDLFTATKMTCKRLARCKPGAGGVDLQNIKYQE